MTYFREKLLSKGHFSNLDTKNDLKRQCHQNCVPKRHIGKSIRLNWKLRSNFEFFTFPLMCENIQVCWQDVTLQRNSTAAGEPPKRLTYSICFLCGFSLLTGRRRYSGYAANVGLKSPKLSYFYIVEKQGAQMYKLRSRSTLVYSIFSLLEGTL